MPKPLSICIEDLRTTDEEARYLRCVAIPGGQPGLGLTGDGKVLWKAGDPIACELWISADDKLILRRLEGAIPVEVCRAGRATEIPATKPVVLLDQDEIHFAGHAVRIHVHGEAAAIHPPTPLRDRLIKAAGIAAALALTATPAAADKVEVRDHPPKPTMPRHEDPENLPRATPPDAGVDAGAPAPKPPVPPLEIRNKPPAPMALPRDPPPKPQTEPSPDSPKKK